MHRTPCVYMLSNRCHGTLYVGVTSDLIRRVWQHKQHAVDGFTRKYHLTRLVWFEIHETMYDAIAREKAVKRWRRNWKIALIERENPGWLDLYDGLL